MAKAELADLRLERIQFLAVACQRQRNGLAIGMQSRHGVDQQIRTLDVPELADIDHVGRVVGPGDRIEFIGGDAVEDAAHQPLRRTDGALKGVPGECTLEQEELGIVHQRAFEAAVDRALDGMKREVQRTAMRRVYTNDALRAPPQSNEGAGLGAMSMQHIGIELPDQAGELRPDQDIGWSRIASDGDAMLPQLEPWRNLLQRGRGTFAARQAVGKDADMMAAVCLSIGKVEDMAKNPADRGADRMQDPKRLVSGGRHDQNPPSPRHARSSMRPAAFAGAAGSSMIAGIEETVARAARMG